MRSVAKELADRPPSFATKLGIVAPAVNVLRDEVAEYAADEHVRREMLARFHAGNVHQRRKAIREDLRERTGIFVRNHAGDGPRCRSMFRGEGSAAPLKERATAIALKRTFAPQGIFHSFDHHKTVDRGFAGKEAGLAPMLVVRGMT